MPAGGAGEEASSTAGGEMAAGGGGGGAIGLACTGVTDLSSSIALRGRGGAMVPNKMLASCLALPPPG
jgi:hypothetical protein